MRERGFSLLELLVLFLVVSALLGMLMPVLMRHRAAAQRSECASNLNQIGKAMYMYAQAPGNDFISFPKSNEHEPIRALNLLYPDYVSDPRVFSCPGNPIPFFALNAITPTTNGHLPAEGTFLSARSCSYAFDPRQNTGCFLENVVMADKKGSLKNSDNHGPNAGQNVLLASGEVEFRTKPEATRKSRDGMLRVTDTDIYGEAPTTRPWRVESGQSWLRQ